MKFKIQKEVEGQIMSVKLVRDNSECIAVQINGKGVIYFNEYAGGTAHIYKKRLKELGISISLHPDE